MPVSDWAEEGEGNGKGEKGACCTHHHLGHRGEQHTYLYYTISMQAFSQLDTHQFSVDWWISNVRSVGRAVLIILSQLFTMISWYPDFRP